MIRSVSSCGAVALIVLAAGQPASGRSRHPAPPAASPAATTPDNTSGANGELPLQIGTFGDWGAYETQAGKGKVCYALAKPKSRDPGGLKRDPAYVFIATRPQERVRNEISVIMGFPLKDGIIDAGVDINGNKFDLLARGENAWVKNAAEEARVIESMRKGSRFVVRVPSKKGHVTTDTYPLSGFAQALDKVAKECP